MDDSGVIILDAIEGLKRAKNGLRSHIFRFPFTPQTHVRVTKADGVWFKMADDKIRSEDGLRRKKRIQRYNEYKITILGYAKEKRFELPLRGCAVFFFLPIPKRRSKRDRKRLHFMQHEQKPDLSNFLKALEDGLLPRKDAAISYYSGLGKFWVDTLNPDKTLGPGWIEVHMNLPVYNPSTGTFIDPRFDAQPLSKFLHDESALLEDLTKYK